MPTNNLTDSRVRAIKPSDKPQKHFDGGGLFLFVSPTGAKVWRLTYRLDGKAQTLVIGAYPEVSLLQARQKRDKVKAELAEGKNPKADKESGGKGVPTFEEASQQYWAGRGDLSPDYVDHGTRALQMHLFPKLGKKPVNQITRAALLAELDRMNQQKLYVYVRKTRMWASQVFDWAVERGHMQDNPAKSIDPKKAFGNKRVEHMAAIELTEVPNFMRRLSMERELQSVLACRLLAYTWVRTSELRQMTWSQIDGNLWRIPASVMKKGRDHLVPLSKQALKVLKKLKDYSRGSEYVFPHERRIDRTMSENTILYLLWNLGYKGKMTGHGWRTVGSTWANENGFNRDAIERQLAHAPDDRVRAAYNRAEFMPERRKMLQEWADWLDSCESTEVDPSSTQG